MSMTAIEFDSHKSGLPRGQCVGGPAIDEAHWGYAIHDNVTHPGVRAFGASVARFVGMLMLIAAAALLVLPDAGPGAELISMKTAWLTMFAVFGLLLVRSGEIVVHPEVHVDTTRGQVRIGRRCLRDRFCLSGTLEFVDVASVYVLRTKDRSRPARLFLRIGDGDMALEVASGPEGLLDVLRQRLASDLAHHPLQPEELRHSTPRGIG